MSGTVIGLIAAAVVVAFVIGIVVTVQFRRLEDDYEIRRLRKDRQKFEKEAQAAERKAAEYTVHAYLLEDRLELMRRQKDSEARKKQAELEIRAFNVPTGPGGGPPAPPPVP